jgi:hypothetical protein
MHLVRLIISMAEEDRDVDVRRFHSIRRDLEDVLAGHRAGTVVSHVLGKRQAGYLLELSRPDILEGEILPLLGRLELLRRSYIEQVGESGW